MNSNALTLRQNVCIYISGWILTVASASSPQIHSARQGLNSSTWKQTDDGRVKASCALWAAPSSKQSIPVLWRGSDNLYVGRRRIFCFPARLWSLMKLCFLFLPSCPVCCMIHNSSFSSSLYDFIVFYKKQKLKETQQTLRVKAQLAFFLPPSVGSLGSPLVFNKLMFSFCINTASKLAAGWLTWKRPYYRWFHKPALFVSWTRTFYTLLPAS